METLYTLQQRNIAQSQTLQAGSARPVTPLDAARANDIFDHFLNASTLKSILGHYRLICDLLHLRPSTLPNFYPKLKQHLTSWRAKAVWKKFDARANNKVYGKGRVCPETRVLIIGAGPCGLRTAIEAQMLGAKVVVLEKRDRMSRNNVLHLWPFVIDDLRSLGAKKFFGKFCAGSIDHISIRQLQCILLKVALLLGIEIHTEVSYESLVEPSIENKRGWRAQVKPTDHPVSQYEFDVIIGADGKRNTLQGFKRKEFRGKLAIAITANFINRRTEAEARVEEISGVAFIFNQKFFKDLYAETQIDLENIVYYKDDTHYFVMTAKKHSLLSKSVIRSDQTDTARLLSPDNVDRAALMAYAREAAEFSTGRQMLDLEFAVNHYGQPDVAMFDFTSMYAAENASRIVDREGYRLLCVLVGDSLLEPFWPTGSGCARGFLSSLDAAWAIRAWGSAVSPLSVLAERESIYRLLGGTTPENLHRDSKSYSLDPSSRYPKLNRQVLSSHQVIGLYDTDDVAALKAQTQKEEEVVEVQNQHGGGIIKETAKKRRKIDEEDLLSWIKKQVLDYNLPVPNLSENTFNDGKILCAILHHYRPDLVDYKDLPEDNVLCCHIAVELLEKEIGISSIIAPSEMATMECTRQQLISYLTQIYETFKREIAHINHPKMKPKLPSKTCSGIQSYATTNSNHSNTSAKHKPSASNNNMLSTTPPPKLYRSPTRNDEDNVQKLYRTNNQPASPLNKSSPNVLTNNKLSSVFDNKRELQLNKIKLPQQQRENNNKVDDHRIKVLDVDEELDEESNNSMEELTARLMDRFRGVVSSGAGGGGGLNATLGDGGGGGKVRVIQTISNPFSAITEKDDDDDDDEVTTDMPELKQHTLNALTGATNTTNAPTESPMHHRNFAGLRATPPHHHQLTQTKPNHHHNHHHIRQAIPLAVTGNNVSASGGGVEAASTVAGSSVATGRSRKRKSAAPAGGGGAGRGDADGVGLHVAQYERQQEITSNRLDRQQRRKHHRRHQTEQFLKSMQMLQANCKPDHSEPFEDYSLFVYRQTAPNFEDRVRDLEKKFIYMPDHPPAQWQQKNERDEDIAARMRQIEDRWYETTAQEANAVAQRNMSGAPKKPKDLMRAIGKIETSDWNIREIEKKIKENRSGGGGGKGGKERVPKWSREQFQARQAKMERKHLLDRQDSTNGKYSELDKNLKLLDQRLKEGTIRDLNQHKIAKIAEKLKPKEQVDNQKERSPKDIKPSPSVVLPSANSSEYCHFCAKRVYLMEKLNAENRCFHRNCFRCEYCHTLLRPGAYKYDTDGKYGHRFYCIHHYGFSGQLPALVSTRNRGAPSTRAQNDTGLVTPTNQPGVMCDSLLTSTPNNKKSLEGTLADIAPTREVVEGTAPLGILGRVTGVDLLDRVQTPERIEFSNLSTGNASSDHEEPPSIMDEDEWTDRNFGASTAEVCSSDDDSYSDSDSEEEYEEAIEEPATKEGNLRILERYSRFSRKHDSDSAEYSSSEQSSYCENTSGDDESDTATEGEEEIRARELRKQEVRLEPPIITDTGTDTEINSDDTVYSKSNEAPNSATEISTDSEFAQDEPTPTREIPAIIFNDAFVTKTRGSGHVARVHITSGDLRKHNNAPPPPPPQKPTAQQNHHSHTPAPKKPTNLPLLNRLTDGFPLNRTQSTSGIAAMRSLELKKRYLLGESNCSVATNAAIQKSGSASTLDSKLKSFHSNITDCQRMLKPAQEGAVRSVFSGDNVAAIGGAAVECRANETAVLVLAKNGEHQTPPLSFTITTQNTSNQPCPSLETTQSKPVKNVPATEQSYQNELEGRPRSPAHETSIIVPTIDWPRRNKPEKDFSDRTSSESDAEVAAERSANIAETVEDKQIDFEPLDSLNYMPLVTDAAPKSICSEKKALNQPKTLPGLFGRPETASGRSTPTQGGGNDSCITGCLTETELSDWARDGAVSDDFDYECEHALTSRKNNEPKKLGNFNSTIESNNKISFDDKLTSLNALDGKSMHVCGRTDDVVECVNSILNPNLKNIDYMDTGSENSSCSDDDVKKNNGYVQFYNENDMADDSLSPVINNLSKLTVLEVKNPLMTATIEDFDELSTPTKNTGFCEVVGATPMPSSNCNFGGTVVDLKPTDLEQLKRKQTLVQNEMDSLQVAADTGTEDNTCSDSTVKNVDDFKPTYDNNNVSVDKKRLEDKLMQVKQDMFTKKSIKDDCELYAAHCQRLQSKLEFTNVRDSIDVRKNAQKNQPILAPSPKPDLIQQDEPQVQFRLTLTPTNLYQKEIIAKERDLNQRLIHEMILHKYKSENKSLERKKRPRNSSFSPCGANTFELSKSATTADLTANNVTPPDVILSTTNTAALKELQKSQTMAEIKITPSNRNVTSTSDKPMVPVLSQQMVPQQVYTCYQIDRTPSYDKMRQEARAKAKLLSDTALGLSPEDKLLRLRERIRGHDNTADAATSQRAPVHRTNSHVALRDTKSGLVVNRNSIAESHFNSAPVDGAAIYAHDTLNSERRNKSFRRPGVADKAPELTGSRSVQNIQRGGFSGGASFKSDSNLLLDKSLGELGVCGNSGEKKAAKDRERRKSITRVISDFFGSIRKDRNSNLSAARGFLARISPKARERSKSCINLPRENLVKETISLRKSASSDLNFSPHSSARDASPPPVPPLPDNYGTKLEDSSDAELDFQRQYSLDNIDPALPVDNTSIGHATGSRRNSRGTAKRSARQAQLKRHRTAQEIQRKLEETEVKIRDLELAGVAIEKRLGSGEPDTTCSGGVGDAKRYAECGGGGGRGRPVPNDVLSEWFGVMRELTEWRRYERELVTRAEELQLEDRHARLQNKLRDKLTCDTTEDDGGVRGTSTDAGVILEEMMDIVAKRDCIIANLEQDKQRYTDEDREFEEQMLAKGIKLIPTFKKSVDSN